MVPVRLALRNFLSYGEAAEPLDFEQFHVACLSGGNGQGKSALLDAVTWALWGQARKSGESRKPDEELLRTGAREMEVDLIFDLEGERYRVVRSFYRTASGKTTKPGLELQVRDAASDGWRTLTGASVAETQAAIESTIRLDYDTFINSAFLLQGRSDEFTRKKPSDRKQILARILGLDRFSKLEAAAREKASVAEKEVDRLAAEAERLKAALADEPRWRDDLAAAEAEAAAHADAVDGLRREATAHAERLAELDALARSAADRRARADALRQRLDALDAEQMDLGARLEAADALIAQQDAIRQAYARHAALDGERSALDDALNTLNGLRNQELTLQRDLDRRRQEHDARITRLDAALTADRTRLTDLSARLATRPALEQSFRAARRASEHADALSKRRDERQALLDRREAHNLRIVSERAVLRTHLGELQRQIREGERAVELLPALRQRCAERAAAAALLVDLLGRQQGLFEEGSEVKARLTGAQAEVQRLEAEIATLDARAARLDSLETETCPTCGTDLTEEHRQEVRRTFADDRAALARQRDRAATAAERLAAERQRVGAEYRRIQAEMAPLAEAEAALQEARTRVEAAAQAEESLATHRARHEQLEHQLAAGVILPEVAAEITEIDERLGALPFDQQAYETVIREAAQAPTLDAQLRELEALGETRDGLDRQVRQREGELARLREESASGGADGDLSGRLDALRVRIAALAYDAARHDAVRRELHALRDAPTRFVELGAALNSAADWRARRARLAEEAAAVREEAAALADGLRALEVRLAERPARVTEQAACTCRLADAEAAQAATQARCGGLRERIEQCTRWRAEAAETRGALKEARGQKSLYTHLRRAFGRNGIPALIIEQTLPEVEDRANALLERLARGRTRVHLETLRDKKAGGTRETLDIRITDDQGVARSYETFSGGEAFRVNFALRIALAQLLADRAGVRIRTLVVDEGFGTQDKQGIEALVEAIQTVHADFEKVLVITHLDELKEAFPVRIEVQKDPVTGSRYDVIGV